MTIAVGYLCSEGIVLGADSTATFPHSSGQGGLHYDHTQKIFGIGEASSLGMVTWGIGGLGPLSDRTAIARLGDQFRGTPPSSVADAAWRWSTLILSEHANYFAPLRARLQELAAKGDQASDDEKKERQGLHANAQGGFCIAGVCDANRTPEAYEVWIGRDWDKPEQPRRLPFGFPKFWGWSSLVDRLHYGMDDFLFQRIIESGKWTGTADELIELVRAGFLAPPGALPIREAIDWVYSSINTTIKGYKFSREMPACGGPIEVAVITTDRRFRWVRHKPLDSAIE